MWNRLMTFFLMCAISGAFHLLWLSIAVSLVVFLDSGSEQPWAIKQHGQVVGAMPLICFGLVKQNLWLCKPYQEDRWVALSRQRLHWWWSLHETERVSCHLHSTVCKEEFFKGGMQFNYLWGNDVCYVGSAPCGEESYRFPSYCTATKNVI